MIYYGENETLVYVECENCKQEIRIDKSQISEDNQFMCKLSSPIKCSCEKVDNIIKKDVQSTYNIRHQISAILELLQKKNSIENKIDEINAEMNYEKKPPAYLSIVSRDILFSVKLFFILLGVGIGLEMLTFIIGGLMYAVGSFIGSPDIRLTGNQFIYNVNIFKGFGVNILKTFNFPAEVPLFDKAAAAEKFVLDFVPYAIAGILQVVFYIGLIALAVRLAVTAARIIYYVTVVLSNKYHINQNREDNEATLNSLYSRLQDLNDQIAEHTIIPPDFQKLRDVETIYGYFINNRVDTVREALNLYQSESMMQRVLEYQRLIYNESKQTKKYTKALYILTSDESAQVEVKEDSDDLESIKMKDIISSTVTKFKNRKKQIKGDSRDAKPSGGSVVGSRQYNGKTSALNPSREKYLQQNKQQTVQRTNKLPRGDDK